MEWRLSKDIHVEAIRDVRERIHRYIRQTPLLKASCLQTGLTQFPNLFLKLDNHQPTGSFKVRGALSKLTSLHKEDKLSRVYAASGGNHGLAVAYAGKTLGYDTKIYLPEGVAEDKIRRMKDLHASVQIIGTNIGDAIEAAQNDAELHHAIYIHPFADAEVIKGQGTLGLDILDQLENVDVIIAAIGGGGLISGVATAAKSLKPNIKVIGVEPEAYPTLYKSVKEGKPVHIKPTPTIMPTLAATDTSELNLEIVNRYVDEIVLVSEEQVRAAARWLWSEMFVAAEFSGSAVMAALLFDKIKLKPAQTICPIICGGGYDGIRSF